MKIRLGHLLEVSESKGGQDLALDLKVRGAEEDVRNRRDWENETG